MRSFLGLFLRPRRHALYSATTSRIQPAGGVVSRSRATVSARSTAFRTPDRADIEVTGAFVGVLFLASSSSAGTKGGDDDDEAPSRLSSSPLPVSSPVASGFR